MSANALETTVSPVSTIRKQRSSGFREVRDTGLSGLWQNRFKALTAFSDLPSTAQLLMEGGDVRIVCGAKGVNPYGCSTQPDNDMLAYGSSTASTISPAGFLAADTLRERLTIAALVENPSATYERELDRMRHDLRNLCGVEELPGLEIIFGASGTDLHLFASQLMVDAHAAAPLIVRVESGETGRGVPDALAGRHFSDCAALGHAVMAKVPLDCGRPIEVHEVKCRTTAGDLRPLATVDAEVEAAVIQAVNAGQRVLITLVDVSKTGLLAPSPTGVAALQLRFPGLVEVLVDACQFRLAPSTLKAYLERDFMVAMTGSKFITGPTFCGALFVPEGASRRMSVQVLPHALKAYSTRADWPRKWAARDALPNVPNYGLLLRWEAALTELRAFRHLSEAAVADFLLSFARAITDHLSRSPALELVAVPSLDRGEFGSPESWDRLPTIFSFLLRRSSLGKQVWLNPDETKKVHELLREPVLPGTSGKSPSSPRCQLGQPVNCGIRAGMPVTALRLCASSRLIVDALSPNGRGPEAVIADAIAVLEKTAVLATAPLI